MIVVDADDQPHLAEVRESLNKLDGPVTKKGLESLSVLDLEYQGIRDLPGLEYCVNLTRLVLCRSQITDVTPLAGLKQLLSLHFVDNAITDVRPLAGLAQLTGLNLTGNPL